MVVYFIGLLFFVIDTSYASISVFSYILDYIFYCSLVPLFLSIISFLFLKL